LPEQLGEFNSPLRPETHKDRAINYYYKAIISGIKSNYCINRLISLINEGVHSIKTAFVVNQNIPIESQGKIDQSKLFYPSIKNNFVNAITDTIDQYITTNLSYKYTLSFSANHGIEGRRRALALASEINAATSIPETCSILINFLRNKKNGNLWSESLRTMLINRVMSHVGNPGGLHGPITSQDFDEQLEILSKCLSQDKLIKAPQEEATNGFCSFGKN